MTPLSNTVLDVFTAFAILTMFVVTAAVVWFLAQLFRWKWPRLSLPLSLVIPHTSLLLLCLALFPTGIFSIGPLFDDLYFGYYLFPGVHLYFLASQVVRPLEPFFSRMPDFWAALSYLLILPGLVCIVLGGIQWYLIGRLVEWIRVHRCTTHRTKV